MCITSPAISRPPKALCPTSLRRSSRRRCGRGSTILDERSASQRADPRVPCNPTRLHAVPPPQAASLLPTLSWLISVVVFDCIASSYLAMSVLQFPGFFSCDDSKLEVERDLFPPPGMTSVSTGPPTSPQFLHPVGGLRLRFKSPRSLRSGCLPSAFLLPKL